MQVFPAYLQARVGNETINVNKDPSTTPQASIYELNFTVDV